MFFDFLCLLFVLNKPFIRLSVAVVLGADAKGSNFFENVAGGHDSVWSHPVASDKLVFKTTKASEAAFYLLLRAISDGKTKLSDAPGDIDDLNLIDRNSKKIDLHFEPLDYAALFDLSSPVSVVDNEYVLSPTFWTKTRSQMMTQFLKLAPECHAVRKLADASVIRRGDKSSIGHVVVLTNQVSGLSWPATLDIKVGRRLDSTSMVKTKRVAMRVKSKEAGMTYSGLKIIGLRGRNANNHGAPFKVIKPEVCGSIKFVSDTVMNFMDLILEDRRAPVLICIIDHLRRIAEWSRRQDIALFRQSSMLIYTDTSPTAPLHNVPLLTAHNSWGKERRVSDLIRVGANGERTVEAPACGVKWIDFTHVMFNNDASPGSESDFDSVDDGADHNGMKDVAYDANFATGLSNLTRVMAALLDFYRFDVAPDIHSPTNDDYTFAPCLDSADGATHSKFRSSSQSPKSPGLSQLRCHGDRKVITKPHGSNNGPQHFHLASPRRRSRKANRSILQ